MYDMFLTDNIKRVYIIDEDGEFKVYTCINTSINLLCITNNIESAYFIGFSNCDIDNNGVYVLRVDPETHDITTIFVSRHPDIQTKKRSK